MTMHATSLPALLLAKAEAEQALLRAPEDGAARQAYLLALGRLAQHRSGLIHAVLPELGHPLYLRAGTSDMAALRRILGDPRYPWLPEVPPRRILEIGAHAGYLAALLARRYPDAVILCVEPDQDTHRLLALNTLPAPRVQRSAHAAWHSTTRLGIAGRDDSGLGPRLSDAMPMEARLVPAFPVADILGRAGLPGADLVICDTAGGEAAVFADPGAMWLAEIDTAAIDIREDLVPGTTALVAACFPSAAFSSAQYGTTTVFRRVGTRAAAPPARLALLHSAPGLLSFRLSDVPDAPWGFYIFDGESCQLHPNPPGGAPATAAFIRSLDGQTRFSTGLTHAGAMAAPIQFSVTLATAEGTPILHARQVLVAGESLRVDLPLPTGLRGPHRIVLETLMIPGAPHNRNAWARFIAPALM